jgi:hypothetical protein
LESGFFAVFIMLIRAGFTEIAFAGVEHGFLFREGNATSATVGIIVVVVLFGGDYGVAG